MAPARAPARRPSILHAHVVLVTSHTSPRHLVASHTRTYTFLLDHISRPFTVRTVYKSLGAPHVGHRALPLMYTRCSGCSMWDSIYGRHVILMCGGAVVQWLTIPTWRATPSRRPWVRILRGATFHINGVRGFLNSCSENHGLEREAAQREREGLEGGGRRVRERVV